MVARTDDARYLIGLPSPGTPDVAPGRLGLWFDAERLVEGIAADLEAKREEGLGILLTDMDGGALLVHGARAGEVIAATDFGGSFPPWQLESYHEFEPLGELLLSSERSVYFYTLVLLACILAFGLSLTMRVVNREIELGRMKSDFVSTVSHELKSPLTSIRQLAEMLEAGVVPSEERRQRYYEVLKAQSERLGLLIDNILDFARMEEGRQTFDFAPVDARALLGEIVDTMRRQVAHQDMRITLCVDSAMPLIRADRSALTQAVVNLIDNAVKYSAGAAEVRVSGKVDGGAAVIAVRDFGRGIEPEDMTHIFDRFYRAGDELTRNVKGTGLGLTLVKQLIKAHGGEVRAASTPGEGSVFTLRVPGA